MMRLETPEMNIQAFAFLMLLGQKTQLWLGGEKVDVAYIGNEAGSFATPPIITTGTTVTRPGNQDIISGLTMNTGVEFCMIADMIDPGSDYIRAIEISDGTTNSRIGLLHATNLIGQVNDNASTQGSPAGGAWPSGIGGMVMAATTNFISVQQVGAAAGTDTSATYPTVDKITFAGQVINANQNVYLRIKEFYMRTNFTPDATSFAEMLTLATARKAIYA